MSNELGSKLGNIKGLWRFYLIELLRHAVTLGVGVRQTGNVNRRRFRLIGSGLIFDKPLILKVFD
jgi:hypothetical protein